MRFAQSVVTEQSLQLQLISVQAQVLCPDCHQPARRIHRRYLRTLAEVPGANRRVRLQIVVRRFFCDQPDCRRQTFVERLAGIAARRARRTQRLADLQQQLGLALGGEAGARLAGRLDRGLSPDTLLRSIRAWPAPEGNTPRILGVDDWARRKGLHYGTILVDLEASRIIDLLPDRSPELLARWLRQHPGVEIVSRDRAEAYADGLRQGAPDAIPVADRWHLLKNLADALHTVLVRPTELVDPVRKAHIQAKIEVPAVCGPARAVAADSTPGLNQPKPETPANQRRRARHQHAHALQARGLSQRQIAEQLGVGPKTVRRYLGNPVYQPEVRPNRKSRLRAYQAYLRQRVHDGCHKAAALWRELRQRGYPGGLTQVQVFVATLRVPSPASGLMQRTAQSALRDLVFTVIRAPAKQTELQKHQLAQLTDGDGPVASACQLGQSFATLMRDRQAEGLADWIKHAETAGPAELRRFARGLQPDETAVRNARSSRWNNGPTEGHINRLKFVKRSMYGRAKFDLLRQRVLSSA